MDPIVFLPGAGGRASFWRPVADRLSDLGPATLLAWPGFGDVPAEPAIASLDSLYRWMLSKLPAGRCHVIAQSMGGVLGARLAIEEPARVSTLCLCATSGGVDVAALGGEDWRPAYRAELPDVPEWFVTDRTDLTDRLGTILARTLLLVGDADPICPTAVGDLLLRRLPRARLQVMAGGAHDLAHAFPDGVAAMLREHLTA
jgi:pimeloyl-ACP methyl ester carboxylesterase